MQLFLPDLLDFLAIDFVSFQSLAKQLTWSNSARGIIASTDISITCYIMIKLGINGLMEISVQWINYYIKHLQWAYIFIPTV